ncbi:MAG: hypothetical protein R3223_13170 [Longimicrobiales bacterium]|nr:hypothetical protein [Longimicrobiales bacterium]
MRYAIGTLLYGLLFSAPGWAVGLFNIGEPAMWAGFAAGTVAYVPFIATACFPRAIEAAMAHD